MDHLERRNGKPAEWVHELACLKGRMEHGRAAWRSAVAAFARSPRLDLLQNGPMMPLLCDAHLHVLNATASGREASGKLPETILNWLGASLLDAACGKAVCRSRVGHRGGVAVWCAEARLRLCLLQVTATEVWRSARAVVEA